MSLLLVSFLVLTSCSHKELPVSDLIRLNQIGFYPSEEKTAIVASDKGAYKKFEIRDLQTSKIVYRGLLSVSRSSSFSPKKTTVLSFSALDTPGEYQIEILGIGKSQPFVVKEHLLQDVTLASLKGFYYQRMSTPIEETYAGKWHRPFAHPDDQVMIHPSAVSPKRPAGTIISSSKGWYDAGDYNKYIVNSGFTVGVLLSLLEDYPEYVLQMNTNIPESGNTTPDLLDEVAWNIDWMLTMQDPADGGVYHKLTTPNFEGFIKPEDCQQQRYVITKSVTASLDFAASMAQAARIFTTVEEDYPGYSDKMLAASRRAFEWASKNPLALYRQEELNKKYEPAIQTGAYGDRSAEDEFFWAASELYVTTGEDKYLEIAEQIAPEQFTPPVWSRVAGMGCLTFIRYGGSFDERGKELANRMKSLLLDYTESAVRNLEMSPYAAPYGREAKDFFWGCNSDAASNQGIAFLYAWLLTGDKKYQTAALSNMDYILGRNATGYCYITGFGYKSPMHPHHRLSASDDIVEPIPGLLIGGPNPGKQDKCEYPSDIPDECYVDDQASYASNEMAINWQGLFTYFSAALDASLEK
ncbi:MULTISPECIES: glycoside hydrolase family 9 protein [unclassified Parabacteroides]|uniref:glycoside hydrolase family 9 protein n=1 Tax=unclassified Parabacteroides TaxID=2649774 RepID=UPI002473A76D|nr:MULTISPECIES: glycoside hydrolase family 9 protein [unclassified Parabacteroides]